MSALVHGESLTSFEVALQDARTNEDGSEATIMVQHVTMALDAVQTTMFPHQALEIQKLWMNKKMFKLPDLSTNQTAVAINWLNNASPIFPMGSKASKFSDVKIIGLLEWLLPLQWRKKFDLDGYMPMLHLKARLIEAYEVIEWNIGVEEKAPPFNKKSNLHHGKKRKNDNSKSSPPKGDSPNKKSYYCSEHGKNWMYAPANCYTIKNQEKKGSQGSNWSFSNKFFCKEINHLAKNPQKRRSWACMQLP